MKNLILLILTLSVLLASCKGKKGYAKEKMSENIEKSWALLDVASKQKETCLSIPMGFKLGCTYEEYERRCDTLVKKNGGESSHDKLNSTTLMIKEFGGVKSRVFLDVHDNFEDSKNKYINTITFRFIDLQSNYDLYGGWKTLRDSISSKFDDSWETVEFDLMDVDKPEFKCEEVYVTNYYKYWVHGNMAVEFNFNHFHGYPTLKFYNVPKYGANKIKVSIPTDDKVDDGLRYREIDEEKMRNERAKEMYSGFKEFYRRYGK